MGLFSLCFLPSQLLWRFFSHFGSKLSWLSEQFYQIFPDKKWGSMNIQGSHNHCILILHFVMLNSGRLLWHSVISLWWDPCSSFFEGPEKFEYFSRGNWKRSLSLFHKFFLLLCVTQTVIPLTQKTKGKVFITKVSLKHHRRCIFCWCFFSKVAFLQDPFISIFREHCLTLFVPKVSELLKCTEI